MDTTMNLEMRYKNDKQGFIILVLYHEIEKPQ